MVATIYISCTSAAGRIVEAARAKDAGQSLSAESFRRPAERLIYGESEGAGKPVLALLEDAFNNQEMTQP